MLCKFRSLELAMELFRVADKTMPDQHDVTGTVAQLPRLAGHVLLKIYRCTLSPLLGTRCRHLPSCSEYADEAIARFGLWAGGWMALARILRCQPFGTHGLDFVPAAAPAGARWYLPWRYGRWRGTNETPARPA
jgi:putative membrane protein insertion efficiency factor